MGLNPTIPDIVRRESLDDAKTTIRDLTIRRTGREPTFIFRKGSGSNTDLTPQLKDRRGLSYQLSIPTVKSTLTSMELVNATGVLMAIQDKTDHVSVRPINITLLQGWINSRPTAETNPHEFTQILSSISIKVRK